MSSKRTDDVRILALRELAPPTQLIRDFPCTEDNAAFISKTRQTLHRILHGTENRLMIVIGPCSIHDSKAALEYASRLAELRARLSDALEIVMRVYFEKPRTTLGWKGLINDPYLNSSFKIDEGLRLARELLVKINQVGVPAGTEYLDLVIPQYLADLISWGAIGARTTESQLHRELASGLSCPVGFKNGTDGNVKIAIDAVNAASRPHHFLSVSKRGRAAIVSTLGNADCHLILRGGAIPNYDAASVEKVCAQMRAADLATRLMIDISHANSGKQHERQMPICANIAAQIACGDHRIIGVMIESYLVAGQQNLGSGRALRYGQSITDACIGWEDSVAALEQLAHAVRQRRTVHTPPYGAERCSAQVGF